jgi:8-oxo-dGTP diphosphatase
MLHRNYPPNQGYWNGVGGRIEPGESPMEACLREVQEETGYHLDSARYAGVLTWDGFEIPAGGLHIFTAAAPSGVPTASEEGTLEWKTVDWILSSGQAVDNISLFLPEVLNGGLPQHYHFAYNAGQLLDWQITPLR